jgi:signal transduction histidine kinase
MGKSLFGKILTILVAVLTVSFSVTGVLLGVGLNRLSADQKTEQLQMVAEKTEQALEYFLKQLNGFSDSILFTNYLESVAENSGSIIWVARTDGSLLFYSSTPKSVIDSLEKNDEGWYSLPDEWQDEPLKRGYSRQSGDFYGLFRGTGEEWVTVSKYFSMPDVPPFGITAEGIILVHSKLPTMRNTKYSVPRIFLISGGIGSLAALLLVCVLTRRLVRPLAEMKQAAGRIASGDFNKRIAIRGEDEIAELSRSFNYMVDALENLENTRREFLSNISHELRTPMTTIKGFIDGILDGVITSEDQNAYLSLVRDEVKRMEKLVNDIMDLARFQAGETRLNITVFDINENIRRCVISLQHMIVNKNLELMADFETERLFVRADTDAIQRVLLNLLHNAVKFTPEGGKITVRTYAKNKVYVEVEDNGPGIPEEELPHIFDRFYKADKSRGLDKTGVGLGLAIARNIILSHNETIRVESQEGKGSRFIFTLPGADGPDEY